MTSKSEMEMQIEFWEVAATKSRMARILLSCPEVQKYLPPKCNDDSELDMYYVQLEYVCIKAAKEYRELSQRMLHLSDALGVPYLPL